MQTSYAIYDFRMLYSAIMISLAFVVISVFCSLISLLKVAKVDPLITIGGNE